MMCLPAVLVLGCHGWVEAWSCSRVGGALLGSCVTPWGWVWPTVVVLNKGILPACLVSGGKARVVVG